MNLFDRTTPFILGILAVILAGCVSDEVGPENENSVSADNFDFIGMFVNYADNIIIPNYRAIADLAANFTADGGALGSYCSAIGTASEGSARTTAEQGWRDLSLAIQHSELHILGPATENGGALQNRLISAAAGNLSTCGIDQAVVLSSEDSDFDVATRTSNQRGIGSVEYLLFNPDLTHTCPGQITETADWNSRPVEERRQLRCEYALEVASDVAAAASSLLAAWSTEGGDYRSTFINPASTADSLDALSDALFYLDTDTKDRKLGVPTGIDDACLGFACPDQVEAFYSETSLANVRANLESFENMFVGASGPGFDDIVARSDAPGLVDDFTANIAAAIAGIDASTTSLRSQTEMIDDAGDQTACINAFANPDRPGQFPSCSVMGLIKVLTDDLKVGFTAAVDVDLPDRAQSDND